MAPKEKDLWQLVRDNIKGPHWQRIETQMTGSGIPDLNACYDGTEIWIELKMVRGKSLHVTPFQRGWHIKRTARGGRTFLMARYKHEGGPRLGPPDDRIIVWAGRDINEAANHGLGALHLSLFNSSIDVMNWEELKMLLFTWHDGAARAAKVGSPWVK